MTVSNCIWDLSLHYHLILIIFFGRKYMPFKKPDGHLKVIKLLNKKNVSYKMLDLRNYTLYDTHYIIQPADEQFRLSIE
jgi:hypothetical protein